MNMTVNDIKAGMIFGNVDWDGPSTIVVLKNDIEAESIYCARITENFRCEDREFFGSFNVNKFGDERELILEGTLLFNPNIQGE